MVGNDCSDINMLSFTGGIDLGQSFGFYVHHQYFPHFCRNNFPTCDTKFL